MKYANILVSTFAIVLVCVVIGLIFRYKVVLENNYVYVYDNFTKIMSIYTHKGKIFPVDNESKKKYEKIKKDILITVKYDVVACNKDFPLSVLISNTSTEKLLRTEWRLDINEKYDSKSLIKKTNDIIPQYIGNQYVDTTILEPMEKISICYQLPQMTKPFNEDNMIMRAYDVTPTFANVYEGDLDTLSRF